MRREILRRFNVQVRGDGPRTLVFAHGFGCDQDMWRFLVPAFEADHRVVLFDYLGMGKADRATYDPRRYGELDAYAEDLVEIVQALELERAVLVGHSVSGMIGALAAIRAPRLFSHLVMIGPSPCYLEDGDYHGGFQRADLEGLLDMMVHNDLGWADLLAPTVMQNPERPELAAELHASFCATDPIVAKRFAEATFFSDNRADLARVPVPALILQCSHDNIAPDAVGEFLHAHLPASKLHRLAATGHCPHLSHPQETAAAIRAYLAAAA
jgi:sigma-B regulation protein RsbQ